MINFNILHNLYYWYTASKWHADDSIQIDAFLEPMEQFPSKEYEYTCSFTHTGTHDTTLVCIAVTALLVTRPDRPIPH